MRLMTSGAPFRNTRAEPAGLLQQQCTTAPDLRVRDSKLKSLRMVSLILVAVDLMSALPGIPMVLRSCIVHASSISICNACFGLQVATKHVYTACICMHAKCSIRTQNQFPNEMQGTLDWPLHRFPYIKFCNLLPVKRLKHQTRKNYLKALAKAPCLSGH